MGRIDFQRGHTIFPDDHQTGSSAKDNRLFSDIGNQWGRIRVESETNLNRHD